MKTPVVLICLLAAASAVWAQTPDSPPEPCQKNVSFAVAEGGQPVPAIPKFTAKWVAKKPNQQGYRGLCFSQIPSSSTTNYVVIFSTSESMFEGLTPSAQTYTSATPGSAGATVISSYGGTWSYSYIGVPPPRTTTTVDLRLDDKPKSLYVRAYSQRGRVIGRYNLGGGWFPSRDKLLEHVFADIVADEPPPQKQKPMAAPLSVYYVNCNVDEPPSTETAMASPPSPPKTEPPSHKDPSPHKDPPPPDPVLDLWSNPAGADIFVDGAYVGKTPYSLTVQLGEHTITLRKKDFGTWQRKVLAAAGKRRVGGYLEQKTLELQ